MSAERRWTRVSMYAPLSGRELVSVRDPLSAHRDTCDKSRTHTVRISPGRSADRAIDCKAHLFIGRPWDTFCRVLPHAPLKVYLSGVASLYRLLADTLLQSERKCIIVLPRHDCRRGGHCKV
jgi:hypothetical protein